MFGKESKPDPYYSPATSGLPDWLLKLGLAGPQQIGNLVLVPLVNGPVTGEPYLTQHEATQRGVLEFLEQGEGSVPQVEAWNHGGTPTLILEGDILIGAKQNREPGARRASVDYVVGENQLGVIALWKDALLGIEIVGHPRTWKEIAQQRIPSLVLAADAAEQDAASRPATHARSASEWLAVIAAARIDARPAIGLGDDVAFTGDTVYGSCLWHEGRPAHLAAFGS